MTTTTYSTDDLVEITVATRRQIEYLVRRGLIEPSVAFPRGQGRGWRWSTADARAVHALFSLNDAEARPGGAWLDRAHADDIIRLAQEHDDGFLVIDQVGASWYATPEDIVAALPTNRASRIVPLDQPTQDTTR